MTDANTWVDEVTDLDHEGEDSNVAANLRALLGRVRSGSETFVGFEIPLAEMWRSKA